MRHPTDHRGVRTSAERFAKAPFGSALRFFHAVGGRITYARAQIASGSDVACVNQRLHRAQDEDIASPYALRYSLSAIRLWQDLLIEV